MEEMKVTQIAEAKGTKSYIGTVPVKGVDAVVILMLPADVKIHKIEFDISAMPDLDKKHKPIPLEMSNPTAPLPNHILYGMPVDFAGRACPLLMWVPSNIVVSKAETHITAGTALPEVKVQPGIVVFEEAGLGFEHHKPAPSGPIALNNLIQNTRH